MHKVSQELYKLSICMMVKDEEENLNRCLNSIQPLLLRDDVELIIVDTGSSDNTVNIAKEFTEKVYFHPWNNNFSDMRNISISYASGEWIFILDADEQIENIEMLKLILDNNIQLKEFNTIQCYVKNFTDTKLNNFVIQPSLRFFRNDQGFRYSGAVHNQPKFKSPILEIELIINHYGYLNDDKELMEKKFNRTSNLLIQQLEIDPNNIYYRYQLSKSYHMNGNYQESLKEIKKAYNLLNNSKLKKSYLPIYVIYAKSAQSCNRFEEVIKICQEGLSISKSYIDLYFYLGFSSLFINDKTAALNAFEDYFRLIEKKDSNKILKNSSFEIFHVNSTSYNKVAKELINLLNENKRYTDVEKYLHYVNEDGYRARIYTEICISIKNFTKLINYYDTNNSEIKSIIIHTIEAFKNNLNEQDLIELEQSLSQLDDIYGYFNKVRISKDRIVKEEALKSFLMLYDSDKEAAFYSEIYLYMLDTWNKVLTEFKKLNNRRLKSMVLMLIKKSDDFYSSVKSYLSQNIPRVNDYQSNRVYINLASVTLLLGIEYAKDEKREIELGDHIIFEKYIECGVNYVRLLYQPDQLRLTYKTLDNDEDKLFITLYFVKEAIKKGDIKGALRYYKEGAAVYPYMTPYLDQYLSNLYIDIAEIYKTQGKYFDAIEMYEEALLQTENEEKHKRIIKAIEYTKEKRIPN